jgi:CRISPR/Cas system-associated exonuclease Cas4 (RecB family)
MINSIQDLKNYTEEQIEEVRRSISFTSLYYAASRENGRQRGMTKKEYDDFMLNRTAQDCRSCGGSGVYMPKARSVGTIHASSSHYCRTRLYYDLTAQHAPESTISPELQITFQIGHAIHEYVQNMLHKALPGRFRDEVKVDLPEAFILGSSTDGVAEMDQARVLLEIKTIGSEFERLTKPKEEHIGQAMGIYATALNVPFVSFLYVSKTWPHSIKEYVVTYDPKVYQRWFRAKIEPIEKALETGEPPIADSDKHECTECPYAKICDQAIRAPKSRKFGANDVGTR